jgi:hypothetical protein
MRETSILRIKESRSSGERWGLERERPRARVGITVELQTWPQKKSSDSSKKLGLFV